jgi:hypothetical protein
MTEPIRKGEKNPFPCLDCDLIPSFVHRIIIVRCIFWVVFSVRLCFFALNRRLSRIMSSLICFCFAYGEVNILNYFLAKFSQTLNIFLNCWNTHSFFSPPYQISFSDNRLSNSPELESVNFGEPRFRIVFSGSRLAFPLVVNSLSFMLTSEQTPLSSIIKKTLPL